MLAQKIRGGIIHNILYSQLVYRSDAVGTFRCCLRQLPDPVLDTVLFSTAYSALHWRLELYSTAPLLDFTNNIDTSLFSFKKEEYQRRIFFMWKTFMRQAVSFVALSMMGFGLLSTPMLAHAQLIESTPNNFNVTAPAQYFGRNQARTANEIVPGGNFKDPRDLARNIINIVLGFLGIIAVVIILFAGFQWMTAGGEEDKVKTAQQRLIQGAVGMVLIVAAWIIAYFVIDQIVKAVQS